MRFHCFDFLQGNTWLWRQGPIELPQHFSVPLIMNSPLKCDHRQKLWKSWTTGNWGIKAMLFPNSKVTTSQSTTILGELLPKVLKEMYLKSNLSTSSYYMKYLFKIVFNQRLLIQKILWCQRCQDCQLCIVREKLKFLTGQVTTWLTGIQGWVMFLFDALQFSLVAWID